MFFHYLCFELSEGFPFIHFQCRLAQLSGMAKQVHFTIAHWYSYLLFITFTFIWVDILQVGINSITVSNYKFNFINVYNFFKCRNNNLKIGAYLFTTMYYLIIWNLLECLWVASRIISVRGDIEIDPETKSNLLKLCFSLRHRSLNSLSAHLFTKISFPSAYISVEKLALFASQKFILIPKFHLMAKIWKYLDTIFSGKITHLTVNVMESVFTIKACPHLQ